MHEALTRPSLEGAFRTMARTDLDAAGRLLLDLLPLQRVVYPHAVAYDLVLAPDRCVWVSVPNGHPTIEVQTSPRPRQEVDFQVVGEPARIARLLTASRLRRLLRRGTARVRGRREGLAALSSLLGAPLDLRALHRAGVRPDPLIAFGLLAAMIDPAWTATERFTVAHAPPGASRTYLIVHEGRPLSGHAHRSRGRAQHHDALRDRRPARDSGRRARPRGPRGRRRGRLPLSAQMDQTRTERVKRARCHRARRRSVWLGF